MALSWQSRSSISNWNFKHWHRPHAAVPILNHDMCRTCFILLKPTDQLLNDLLLLQTSERLPALRDAVAAHHQSADALPDTLIKLGDEAEQLVVVEVARAIVAAEMVVTLADEVNIAGCRARARRAHAQSLAYAGRHAEALQLCDDAIRIAEQAGQFVQAARARLASIHSLTEIGRYDDAIANGLVAHKTLMDVGEPALAGRADFNLGVVYRKKDFPKTAIEHFERAREALQNEPIILAQLESNRGEALLELNHLPEAEAAFMKALDTFQHVNHTWGMGVIEGNLAELAIRQGRLDRAIHFFERARRRIEVDQAPTHLARLLVEHADVQTQIGMFTKAINDYKTALAILLEHGQTAEANRAQIGLARAHMRCGLFRKAAQWLEDASATAAEIGHGTTIAFVNLLHSELTAAVGKAEKSREFAEQSLQGLAERPIDAARAQYRLAKLSFESDDTDTALQHLSKAIATAKDADIAPLLADLFHLRGEIHMYAKQHDDALSDLRHAVAQLERVRGVLQADRFRAAFLTDRSAVYESLIAALIKSNATVAEVFHATELARSRALLDLMTGAGDVSSKKVDDTHESSRLQAELTIAQEALNNLYSQFDEAGNRAWQSEVATLEQRIAALEDRLASGRNSSEQTPSILASQTTDLRTLQNQLTADAAVISFFICGRDILALVISRESASLHRFEDQLDELVEQLRKLRFQIGRGLRSHQATSLDRLARLTDDFNQSSRSISDMLFAPLVSRIKSKRQLIILPHRCLHDIPFAALHDGSKYLIDQFEILHSLSATIYASLCRSDGNVIRQSDSSLIVGMSDELAPTMRLEAESVAKHFSSSTILLDEDATTSNIIAASPRAKLIHLACHGRFDVNVPMASGLQVYDRWLTVRDILKLNLPDSFVTLSGCETGQSEASRSDDRTGLLRAFFAAGARTLAVSQWIVEDETTKTLMTEFYRTMQCGESATTALRKAQQAVRKTAFHPAYWAAFQIIGRE